MKHSNNPISVFNAFQLYNKYGNKNYIGEHISQLEHATQIALLAEEEGYDAAVILGASFHDLGHLIKINDPNCQMGTLGVKNHAGGWICLFTSMWCL